MKIFSLGAIALFAFVTIGCDKPDPAPHGTIALLDLDAVAKRLGRDTAIAGQLKATNDTLVSGLAKSRDELQAKFDSSRQSVGETPTNEQAQQLAQLSQSMNSQLAAKQQAAQNELSTKQVELVSRFREEVRPVAQKAAEKKGMNLVLLRSDITVLYGAPAIDITDDVVGEMISQGKAVSPTADAPTATP